MTFEEILNTWENGKNTKTAVSQKKIHGAMDEWLDTADNWEGFQKEADAAVSEPDPALIRSRLKRMAPEAEIDIHGYYAEDAVHQLDNFLKEASLRGLRKVLIIHGKGNHSRKDAVLPDLVRNYLTESPYAGEIGTPDRYAGGKGATWVILKKRTFFR